MIWGIVDFVLTVINLIEGLIRICLWISHEFAPRSQVLLENVRVHATLLPQPLGESDEAQLRRQARSQVKLGNAEKGK